MAIARLTLADNFSGPAANIGDSITRLRDGMKLTAVEGGRFTDTMGNMAKGIKWTPDAVKPFDSLDDAFHRLLGSGPGAITSMSGLSDAMGATIAAIDPVTLAITALEIEIGVLVGVVALAAAGLVAMMSEAIGVTQGADALRNAMQALTGDGQGSVDMVNRLAGSLPIAKGQLADWAKMLAAAGYSGKGLEDAILAVASAQAIMGDSGAQAAQQVLRQFKEMADAGGNITINKRILMQMSNAGVSAQALAAQLGISVDKLNGMKISADKLGDAMKSVLIKNGKQALEDMSMTWGSMFAKLQEGIASLFADPAIAAGVHDFMKAMKDLFGIGNKGATGMSVLGVVVKTILVPAFKLATIIVKGVTWAIKEMINIGLKVLIWFDQFKRTAVGAATIKAVLVGIVAVVAVLGFVFGALAVVIGGAIVSVVGFLAMPIVAIGLLIAAFGAVAAAGVWLGAMLSDFVGSAAAALAGWASGAVDAAVQFIAGLVAGIQNGTGVVIAAIQALAGGAISALKGALGIASPSKVMLQMGLHTGSGMAEGLKRSQGNVADASSLMASSASSGASDGASGGGGKSSGASLTVNVQPGAIVIQGGSGQNASELTENALMLLFERVALARGLT